MEYIKEKTIEENCSNLSDEEVDMIDNIDISLNIVYAILLPGIFLITKRRFWRFLLAILCSFVLWILYYLITYVLNNHGFSINLNEYYSTVVLMRIAFYFFCFYKIRKLLWQSWEFDKAILNHRYNRLEEMYLKSLGESSKSKKVKHE